MNPANDGWGSVAPGPIQINNLARGMFIEWLAQTPANRTHMWRQAMQTEPGPTRLAMLRFLRMVESHQRGEAA